MAGSRATMCDTCHGPPKKCHNVRDASCDGARNTLWQTRVGALHTTGVSADAGIKKGTPEGPFRLALWAAGYAPMAAIRKKQAMTAIEAM